MASTQVDQVLHMNQGTGDSSYAKTSYIQKQVLVLTGTIKEKAIREFIVTNNHQNLRTLCIADLGCSSAELNNLSIVSELVAEAERARRETLQHGWQPPAMDYQVYLNDLPSNDFNTIFKSLPIFEDKLKKEMGNGFGDCFVNGVPGSFHGRLFPHHTLHFVHSSYSLMWLSKVPEGIEDNKRNIYIARTSPNRVLTAYYEQFETDFTNFLRCRSKEVVSGGRMVLTILGRKTSEAYSKESCYMWELLAMVLNDMVIEGVIEEEKLNTFNLPQYNPSAKEITCLVEREKSFTLDQIHISQVDWELSGNDNSLMNPYSSSNAVFGWLHFTNCMRSVAEPLLINHFGDAFIEEIFKRYSDIVCDIMTKEKNSFINITMVMTKKTCLLDTYIY